MVQLQRPFVCEVCEATFLRASHLKAHARSHMDEVDKPSQCQECDKRFWTNQHLKKHVDTMHRGKTYDVSSVGPAHVKARSRSRRRRHSPLLAEKAAIRPRPVLTTLSPYLSCIMSALLITTVHRVF
jgi:hypothetical protein